MNKNDSYSISIIVPIYNMEQYLRQCLDSILAQSYTDYELILVNDGSTDGSVAICQSYAALDHRIKVINKINGGGGGSARNAGLNNCSGNYITFVDPDDYLDEGMLEKMLTCLRQEDADMVTCGFKRFSHEGVFYIDNFSKREVHTGQQIGDLVPILIKNKAKTIVVWGTIYKKWLFNELRFPEGLKAEDNFVSTLCYALSKKIVLLNECLYYYRDTPNSISKTSYNLDIVVIYAMVYEELRKYGCQNKQVLASMLQKASIGFYRLVRDSRRNNFKIKGISAGLFTLFTANLKFPRSLKLRYFAWRQGIKML